MKDEKRDNPEETKTPQELEFWKRAQMVRKKLAESLPTKEEEARRRNNVK